MNALVLFFAVALLALHGCSKQTVPEPEPVPRIVTASLVVCLTMNECAEETDVQHVNDETLYQISLKDGDTTLLYFYTNRDRFGVTFMVSEANQLLMEDQDLDGKVDKVTQLSENVPGVKIYGPGSELYPKAQRIYSHAMKIAEESIIPSDLLEFMREEEELRKKEEEKRIRRYST